MIAIPGSLSISLAKLVMTSSTPAKSTGMPDTRPKIRSFVDCPDTMSTPICIRNCVLSTSNAQN